MLKYWQLIPPPLLPCEYVKWVTGSTTYLLHLIYSSWWLIYEVITTAWRNQVTLVWFMCSNFTKCVRNLIEQKRVFWEEGLGLFPRWISAPHDPGESECRGMWTKSPMLTAKESERLLEKHEGFLFSLPWFIDCLHTHSKKPVSGLPLVKSSKNLSCFTDSQFMLKKYYFFINSLLIP